MENVKILVDGVEKEVFGIFYIYNSKYYFIYTDKEIDENGYVILYMLQVGKETQNTPNGPVDTGFMVGVEITDLEEQKQVQNSISIIVDDKKNGTLNPQIKYLPMSMITKLKVVSKKRFRLLKSVMEENFKLSFEMDNNVNSQNNLQETQSNVLEPLANIENIFTQNNGVETDNHPPKAENQDIDIFNNNHSEKTENELKVETKSQVSVSDVNNNVIIDYRAKYFEEEEANKELRHQIEQLTQKLDEIKKILE